MKKPRRSSSDLKKEMVLPTEIMLEILKELPVKSLLRLRCVSMLWLSVIDDPFFIELHRTRSQSRPGGIRLLVSKPQEYADSGASIYSADLDGGSKSVCLINVELPFFDSSNNGLVCLERPHRLWNPSTRECIDLPPLPAHKPTGSVYMLRPLQYLFPVFDPSTKTYKVLLASQYVQYIDFRILSLGASTSTSTPWREIDFQVKYFHISIEETCCVNNVIYFRVNLRHETDPSGKQVIFAFDVVTEKASAAFRCPSEGPCGLRMVQVGQKLAVLPLDTSGSATFIRILEDYEEDDLNLEGGCIKEANWKKVSLNFPDDWRIGRLPEGGSIKVAPVGKFHTNKVLFQLTRYSNSIIWFYFYYDLESKTCGTVFNLEDFNLEDFGIHHSKDRLRTSYVETLYRLKL